MLVLLEEEAGEGAPAESGASLPAGTHWPGTQAWPHSCLLPSETGAADSGRCLPASSEGCGFTGGDGGKDLPAGWGDLCFHHEEMV